MATDYLTKKGDSQRDHQHGLDQGPLSHSGTYSAEPDSGRDYGLQERLLWGLSIWYTPMNENGMVTAVALLLLAVLTLLGTTAVVVTSTDILIGGNYKTSEQAFYAAEAGVEEARARLRSTAENPINDPYLNQSSADAIQWRAYIGTLAIAQKADERCKGCVGYDPDMATHSIVPSLLKDLTPPVNVVVEIKHKTERPDDPDDPGNIMYWGDDDENGTFTRNVSVGNSNNRNIYLVTSSGYTGNSFRTVQAEVTKVAPIPVPSPLYIKAPGSRLQGSSTYIIGKDQCGGPDKHAVMTINSPGSVEIEGGPNIIGVGGNPDVYYNAPNMNITAMVQSLKSQANFSYDVTSDTQTGMHWGTPMPGATQQHPSTCSERNVVYYNTHGTYIKLAGGSSGCGILLVDGDLEVNGGFAWNGIILVTGSVKYTGGGSEPKQITGGMLSGGTVDADVVGGNTNIVYCSSAVKNQTDSMPLRSLSWRDLREVN